MTFRGRIKDGQVVLEGAPRLPDGTEVVVQVVNQAALATLRTRRNNRIQIDPQLAQDIATGREFDIEQEGW